MAERTNERGTVRICEHPECNRITTQPLCDRHRSPDLGKRRSVAQERSEIREAMRGLVFNSSTDKED